MCAYMRSLQTRAQVACNAHHRVRHSLLVIATMGHGASTSSATDPPPAAIIHEWDEWWDSDWWWDSLQDIKMDEWEFESYAKLPLSGAWASWRWYWEPSPTQVYWTVLRQLTEEAESIQTPK